MLQLLGTSYPGPSTGASLLAPLDPTGGLPSCRPLGPRCHIISSYYIVDLKRQNRLKVGTNKPKLKVKMQSVSDSDDDVRKRLLEQPRFELAAKGVFRLGR